MWGVELTPPIGSNFPRDLLTTPGIVTILVGEKILALRTLLASLEVILIVHLGFRGVPIVPIGTARKTADYGASSERPQVRPPVHIHRVEGDHQKLSGGILERL
jgi:hypothetical protein